VASRQPPCTPSHRSAKPHAGNSPPCPRCEANAWSGFFVPFTILDPLFGDCTAIFILMQFSTNAFRNRLRRDARDNALSLRGKTLSILPARPHFVVNAQVADIFKRILESWNSTENGKRFAKSGGRKICRAAVYHARINHDADLRESNGL
jgi:hypothetical protein